MARSRCVCGSQNLWKAHEPDSDEWYFIRRSRLPDNVSELAEVAEQAAMCSKCGRIWVAWRDSPTPSEYAPVDSPAKS